MKRQKRDMMDRAYQKGYQAGVGVLGDGNTLVGSMAGVSTSSGSNLTVLGSGATFAASGLAFATAIGSGAVADSSNSVVLGRASDQVEAPGDGPVFGPSDDVSHRYAASRSASRAWPTDW